MRKAAALLLTFAVAGIASGASAQVATLRVTDHSATKTYTHRELLHYPGLHPVTVEDRLYGKPMNYLAVPMADFLRNMRLGDDDYLKAISSDNYAVSIPVRLLRPPQAIDVEAFLAIEDPAKPWPAPPKDSDKDRTGPFYIVWKSKAAGQVSREYWSDQLASLTVVDNPLKRWPGLDVAAAVPHADPVRNGLDRFVALCITCHKVKGIGGAGAASGPDLAQPKSVLKSMDAATFRKFVRNPKSLRPESKMPKFDETALHDEDLDAMIAWLAHTSK